MTDTTAALDEKPGFETGYRTKGYRAYVLGSLLIVYIFNFIDRSIFGILTDPIRNSLGLEDWQMGLLGVWHSPRSTPRSVFRLPVFRRRRAA